MRPAVVWRWLWLGSISAPLLGCSKFRATRECRELSAVVEAGRLELAQVTRPNTPAAYRSAGPVYQKIADQLRRTVSSKELELTAEEYARSVEAIAPGVRSYADALESKEGERIEAVRLEVERAARREQLASRRLENQCHGRF
jgi:hypothetical protein